MHEYHDTDLTFEGITRASSKIRADVLAPYPKELTINLKFAFSTEAMKQRVAIVDSALIKLIASV